MTLVLAADVDTEHEMNSRPKHSDSTTIQLNESEASNKWWNRNRLDDFSPDILTIYSKSSPAPKGARLPNEAVPDPLPSAARAASVRCAPEGTLLSWSAWTVCVPLECVRAARRVV